MSFVGRPVNSWLRRYDGRAVICHLRFDAPRWRRRVVGNIVLASAAAAPRHVLCRLTTGRFGTLCFFLLGTAAARFGCNRLRGRNLATCLLATISLPRATATTNIQLRQGHADKRRKREDSGGDGVVAHFNWCDASTSLRKIRTYSKQLSKGVANPKIATPHCAVRAEISMWSVPRQQKMMTTKS